MLAWIVLLAVAVSVVTVTWACARHFGPRIRAGETAPGRASAITLIALLTTPVLASVVLLALASTLIPNADAGLVYGAAYHVWAAYSVGLVCFIVTNRRFARLGRQREAATQG